MEAYAVGVADVMERVKQLNAYDLRLISGIMDGSRPQKRLNARATQFTREYAAVMDATIACERMGCKHPSGSAWHYVRDARTMQAAANLVIGASEASGLTATYVREFIKDVLELCPTDYFFLAPDGAWCIDPVEFRALPHRVKRLVEHVEVRMVGGRQYVGVRFLSKTAALAMAAKYTLVQKVEAQVSPVPWDAIGGSAPDVIEQRLASVEQRNGSS